MARLLLEIRVGWSEFRVPYPSYRLSPERISTTTSTGLAYTQASLENAWHMSLRIDLMDEKEPTPPWHHTQSHSFSRGRICETAKDRRPPLPPWAGWLAVFSTSTVSPKLELGIGGLTMPCCLPSWLCCRHPDQRRIAERATQLFSRDIGRNGMTANPLAVSPIGSG